MFVTVSLLFSNFSISSESYFLIRMLSNRKAFTIITREATKTFHTFKYQLTNSTKHLSSCLSKCEWFVILIQNKSVIALTRLQIICKL